MKRLLFLGGADIQISAIKKAKELGYYVITCDYLPENPGHKFSDEYHNISTTDIDAVLNLAKEINIDGVTAYGSDPAALTASYVSEKLLLPGNPYKSIQILSNKVTFRQLQHSIALPAPKSISITSVDDIDEVKKIISEGEAIIKPVDSSGSKGIYRINKKDSDEKLKQIIAESLSFSRAKQLVAEEYINRKGFLMSGDFMVEKSKIVFSCFGDVHFNTWINGIVPRSISLPVTIHNDKLFFEKLKNQLQALVDSLDITTGVFNCDVIADQNGTPFILDIGARNGGNMFNDIISYHTGFDLIGNSMKQCVGDIIDLYMPGKMQGYYAHNVIHSHVDGILERIEFSDEIEKQIIYKNILVKKGDNVKAFVNSSHRLGLVLLKFNTFEEQHSVLDAINKHVRVIVLPFKKYNFAI